MASAAAPPQEEDKEEIPLEKYMPAGISEEEAIQDSKLVKLFEWEGLDV
jgi:hypothetical protein